MKNAFKSACVLAVVAAASARADTFSLVHAATLYSDKGDHALSRPEGVACAVGGIVVVADTGNGRLLRLTFQNGTLSPAAEWKLPELGHPGRVQFDANGDVLSLDQRTRRITRLSPSGELKGTLDLGGVAPVAFKAAPGGGILALDVRAGEVVLFDAAGKAIRRVPLPKGSFTDVAAAQGTLYAVDASAAVVYAAQAKAASFAPFARLRGYASFPSYIAVTDRGLLVVDSHGNGLVSVGPDGSFLGRQLSIGWSEGFVYYPGQICLDGTGSAFVADRGNNRLQVFAIAK